MKRKEEGDFGNGHATPDGRESGAQSQRGNPFAEFEERLAEHLSRPVDAKLARAPQDLRQGILEAVAAVDPVGSNEPAGYTRLLGSGAFQKRFAMAAAVTILAFCGALLVFDDTDDRTVAAAGGSGSAERAGIPGPSVNVPHVLGALVSDPYGRELENLARDVVAAENHILHVLTAHLPANVRNLPVSTEGLNSRAIMRFNRALLDAEDMNGS